MRETLERQSLGLFGSFKGAEVMRKLFACGCALLLMAGVANATSTITLELSGPASISNDGVSSTTLEVREQHLEGKTTNALVGLTYRLEGFFAGYDPSAVPTPTVFRGSSAFDGTGPGGADTGNGNAAGPWDSGTPGENGYGGFTVAGDYLHNQARYVVPAAGSLAGSATTTRLVDTITLTVDPGTAPGTYCVQFNDNDTIAPQWYNAGAQTLYFLGAGGVGYFGPLNNSSVCVEVTPEPSALALLGLAGLVTLRRRR
jgi:MYXO-CTERM domain-containing protein